MTDQTPRRRELGRGLSALLGETAASPDAADAARRPRTLPVEHLRPSRFQPRRAFTEADIESLADSVREQGILQPILVRPSAEDPAAYEIVAGERRWRAAQAARLHEVPVIVREISDHAVLEIALVENIQRQDLSPLEEAEGYRRLIAEFSHTQEHLAKAVGKSRSHVANTLRLLNLPDAVKALIDDRRLTAGHARALLNAPAPEALAASVVKRGLNVRQTERLVRHARAGATPPHPAPARDPDTVALEQGLSNLLGLKVSVEFRGDGGRLTIRYRTLEQLDDLLQRLGREPSARWWPPDPDPT